MPPCSAPGCWWWILVLGVAIRHVICGFYLFIYLFFLQVMLPSEIPKLPTDPPVKGFPGVWKLLFFYNSLLGWVSIPNTFVSLLSFIVCPTSFRRQWAAFLGAWCPLPEFRSCFVEFSQCSNVLSMNLWGRKWSPRPIPLPS